MSDSDRPDREEVKRLVQEMLRHGLGAQVPQTSEGAAGQAAAPFSADESARSVITEDDLRGVPDGGRVKIAPDAIITPLARDLAAQHSIELVRAPRSRRKDRRPIAVGADHGGFEMKERLKEYLSQLGYSFQDFGTHSTSAVDYPDYAHLVARAVSSGQYWRGIIIDGAGIGSCMVANKVPGVRAAMCYDVATARNSREHNDANVLTLGGKMIDEARAKEIVKVWLETDVGEERHRQRVAKIMAIEKQYLQ